MPTFDYKAVTPQGEVKTGQMAAGSETEVIARLQAMGWIPMSSQHQAPRKGTAGSGVRLSLTSRRRQLNQKDIADFTRQLSILIGAGLPLDRSLQVLRDVSTLEPQIALVDAIQSAVRGGDALSEALLEHSELFPPFYVNFVRSAELSGNLAQSLGDLSEYLEKSLALREQVRSALIYPAVLVAVTLLSIAVIVIFVLPEFAELFADMDTALPASTAIVLGAAEFLREYFLILVIVTVGIAVYWRQQARNPVWQEKKDARLLRLPLAGELVRKIDMARFSRSLGTLLGGGVSLMAAIGIARDSLSNRTLAADMASVEQSLRDGGGLAEPLLASGAFPEFAVQMIQVGEETGQLDEMLIKVADIYDREVAVATQRLLSVMEPIMIIGLGLVIGGIIMSVLVAIWGMNEAPL